MKTDWFDFVLPPSRIAQQPASERSSSRLCVLHRQNGYIEHRQFSDIVSFFSPGDVLVLNNTQVIRARLFAKRKTGGACELLLLREKSAQCWEALVSPGGRIKDGEELMLVGAGPRACPQPGVN